MKFQICIEEIKKGLTVSIKTTEGRYVLQSDPRFKTLIQKFKKHLDPVPIFIQFKGINKRTVQNIDKILKAVNIKENERLLDASDCLIQDSCKSYKTERCNKKCKLYK